MQLTKISGRFPLAAAIRYALTRMERLRPRLDHGIPEPDNNAAERGMRAISPGQCDPVSYERLDDARPECRRGWNRRRGWCGSSWPGW